MSRNLRYLYRCSSDGQVNNGRKPECNFEMEFDEGTHHCPICGHLLMRVPTGPSVTELLRRGQQEVDRQKKGTKK
jgi:hypothetical protein